MSMKRQKCPAPRLSAPRLNTLLSIALFYKREINIDDARAINPTAFKDSYEFKRTLKRLEELSYVRCNGDRFQITQYGAQMLPAYEAWKRENDRLR